MTKEFPKLDKRKSITDTPKIDIKKHLKRIEVKCEMTIATGQFENMKPEIKLVFDKPEGSCTDFLNTVIDKLSYIQYKQYKKIRDNIKVIGDKL